MKTQAEHVARHNELHSNLDELTADFIEQTGGLPSNTTLLDLIKWSHLQTLNPSDIHEEYVSI